MKNFFATYLREVTKARYGSLSASATILVVDYFTSHPTPPRWLGAIIIGLLFSIPLLEQWLFDRIGQYMIKRSQAAVTGEQSTLDRLDSCDWITLILGIFAFVFIAFVVHEAYQHAGHRV